MSEKKFTVPDFYSDFRCKMGACRRSCCYGWHITVSMDEYFRLIGLDCPPEIRRKLDGGVFMLEKPTPERYAEFSKNYVGDCPLHGEDGLCSLQCSCGEDFLPSVCRYYPRSPRTLHGNHCSVSASCEGVVELLMNKTDKMTFTETRLNFGYHLPEPDDSLVSEYYAAVRRRFIKILQNRNLSLEARLKNLVVFGGKLNTPFVEKNRDEVEKILAEDGTECVNNYAFPAPEAVDEIRVFITRLGERYPLEKYTERLNQLTPVRYPEMKQKLARVYPSLPTAGEQILVNHLFYVGFPFESNRESVYESCASFASLYAVWMALASLCLEDSFTPDSFADLTADVFRMSENSNYDLLAAAFLYETGFMKEDKLCSLCGM